MALATISSKTHFYRHNTHGPHPFPNTPAPITAANECPPAVKKILRLMHQRSLFGQDCIQLYFTHLIRNCRSDNTIRSYQTTLLAFFGFLQAKGKHHIEMTTRDDISAYVEYEQDRGLCVNSVNTQRPLKIWSHLRFYTPGKIFPKISVRATTNLVQPRDSANHLQRMAPKQSMIALGSEAGQTSSASDSVFIPPLLEGFSSL